MGERLSRVVPGFNRSLRVETRADRLTVDPGVVVLREVLEHRVVGDCPDERSAQQGRCDL